MQFNRDGSQRRPRQKKIPSAADRRYQAVTVEENDAVVDPTANQIVDAILTRIQQAAEYQKDAS